jgi:hypothetical protein
MVPKVDTFEVDIANEIKRKEASLAEISAASNNVGNNDGITIPRKPPVFFIALGIFFLFAVLGLAALAYFYYSLQTPQIVPQTPATTQAVEKTADIDKISPTLGAQIGRFVATVTKKDQGYILAVKEYSPVFAYMTRNENDYIDELSSLFAGAPAKTASTSQQQNTTPIKETPPVATTSLRTSSSTQKIASSSSATATKEGAPTSTPPQPESSASIPTITQNTPTWSDVTISNQNMRVWTSGNRTVVYAFVGNTTVLISNSTDGILALKSAILH